MRRVLSRTVRFVCLLTLASIPVASGAVWAQQSNTQAQQLCAEYQACVLRSCYPGIARDPKLQLCARESCNSPPPGCPIVK